jgi:hypothetical protein
MVVGDFYSKIMDAYLLAKHGEYESNFQACTKYELINNLEKLLSKRK